jgi:hypothetical protein
MDMKQFPPFKDKITLQSFMEHHSQMKTNNFTCHEF